MDAHILWGIVAFLTWMGGRTGKELCFIIAMYALILLLITSGLGIVGNEQFMVFTGALILLEVYFSVTTWLAGKTGRKEEE